MFAWTRKCWLIASEHFEFWMTLHEEGRLFDSILMIAVWSTYNWQIGITVGSYQMAHLFNCWLVHICCKNQQNNQNEPSDKGAIWAEPAVLVLSKELRSLFIGVKSENLGFFIFLSIKKLLGSLLSTGETRFFAFCAYTGRASILLLPCR